MGKDGAEGMAELHAAGAFTVAQDEASCVVFGMPKAAIDLGGVTKIAPLKEIVNIILRRAGVAR
jgi:two-component system chemotaxis response regulator CheB